MNNLNIISKIEDLLYSNYLRYGIAIIIIFLNVYNFKNNRQKYILIRRCVLKKDSLSKKCFTCKFR